MIRSSTTILQASTDNDSGCAHVFSVRGTASFHSKTMIGTQVGEPNENKLIIDGERSTDQSSFKSLVAQKDGILTCLFTTEKHATRGPNVTLDSNGSRFRSHSSPTIDAIPGYGSSKLDLLIRISSVLGGAS